jgi:hypothetical protein
MPSYTVTVTRPCKTLNCSCGGYGTTRASHQGVDTLEDARIVVRDHVVASGIAHGTTADPIAPTGGEIKLPNGDTISVKPVEDDGGVS